MRTCYFDLEVQNSPGTADYTWDQPGRLGITVACTWAEGDGYRDFLGHEAADLLSYLKTFDRVVGHNIAQFDLAVLDGALGLAHGHCLRALRGKVYDTLAAVRERLGYRVSLADLAEGTLEEKKAMDGAHAPAEWAARHRLEVIAYCRKDVDLTRRLYEHALAGEELRIPPRYDVGRARAGLNFHLDVIEYEETKAGKAAFEALDA